MREISAPSPGFDPASDTKMGLLARATLIIGIVFYVAGTLSFAGIAVAFFAFRMYALSSDSRIAFIVLFTGLFCALQGLIFILVARGGEARRTQMNYMLQQIHILYSHSAPGTPAPPGSD